MRLSTLLLSVLIPLSGPLLAADACEKAGVSLQVLGSGGPELDDGRASSSYLVLIDGAASVLVDAGTGSAQHFERSGARFEDIQALLLTHLHVDHSADLPAYIKGSYFTDRKQALAVLGPAGNALMPATSEYVNRLFAAGGVYPYLSGHLRPGAGSDYQIEVTDVPIEGREILSYKLGEDILAQAIPVNHGPVAAVAWRVAVGGCSITFSGDMSNEYDTLATLARGTDLLVLHNAIPEGAGGAGARLHMHPSEMGAIAKAAAPGRVLVSHRMNRTLGREEETLAEIRKYYSGPVQFAEDLQRIGPGSGPWVFP